MKLVLPHSQLEVSLRTLHKSVSPCPCPAPLAISASSISIAQLCSPSPPFLGVPPLPGALGTQERVPGHWGASLEQDWGSSSCSGLVPGTPRSSSPERGSAVLPHGHRPPHRARAEPREGITPNPECLAQGNGRVHGPAWVCHVLSPTPGFVHPQGH